MTDRRSSDTPRTSLGSVALAILALAALVAACATPPTADTRTIAISSHAGGERIFGSRTITIGGTAANTAQVQVLLNGGLLATVDVDAGTFQAGVTLDDNTNVIRVQTTDELVGANVELVYPWVHATTFRPADVVLGQPDKVTSWGTSASASSSASYGTPVFVAGILYLPDADNNRILGYLRLPVADGTAADFVLGQATFTAAAGNDDDQDGVPDATPTARTLWCPTAVASDGTRLFVADSCNHRVLIYDALPTTSFAPADVVVGQATMTATDYTFCSMDAPFANPERLAVGGGRLVVPESGGHRVLVWNTIPTENGAEPDLVLGQPASGATCTPNDDDQDSVPGDPTARAFSNPWDAWTDGDRLLVTDHTNYRVLMWETFPTSDFAPADLVIGQASMTTRVQGSGATGFDVPWTVASNGNQILIPDLNNNRVLVFDSFPTTNGAAADAVLGQGSFTNTASNDDDQDGLWEANPTARTLFGSYGAFMGEGVMLVNDLFNNRFLLFVD